MYNPIGQEKIGYVDFASLYVQWPLNDYIRDSRTVIVLHHAYMTNLTYPGVQVPKVEAAVKDSFESPGK